MRHAYHAIIFLILLIFPIAHAAMPSVAIKDLTDIQGVRSNQLIGYGLVVGLDGTGDGNGTGFTTQSLTNMLSRMGITSDANEVKVKNVASVMVTASLPPFVRPGAKIDITVSSLGDATSLEGGTLLLTPLSAPNGEVFAVAQGQITIGGFNAGGGGGGAQKNHSTSGRISNGALVERELGFELTGRESITLLLKQPDFTTADNIRRAIESVYGFGVAQTNSSGAIDVIIPANHQRDITGFIAGMTNLQVDRGNSGKIVINEKTGTIVVGADVRIGPVAISHGNLNVQIAPPVNEDGEPVGAGRNDRLIMMDGNVGIGAVVEALNRMGVSPRDLIAIIQAIKHAGALSGELEFI
ncbi:flagellar basal body P-ring protein FlgI [Chrysiogenes arsenatis]|uniref:flagellar basal body P-ring protein FlgI n=1 Tax=Chrysiogenes arsenatis TaxID=309797 RepID=UPI0004184F20|nr:flagellar basal body P-ring protein FlgI [Chrysiogenes arsenatis]